MAPKKPKTPKTPAPAPVQIPEMPTMTAEEARAAAFMALGQPAGRQDVAKPEETTVTTRRGRTEFVSSDKWLPFLREKYGWLVEIYESVPEIAEIMKRAYIDEQPEADVQNALYNSTWYNSLGPGEYAYIKGTKTNNAAYMQTIADRETMVAAAARKRGYDLSPEAVKQIAADSLKGAWDASKIDSTVSARIVTEKKTPGAPPPAGGVTEVPMAEPTGLQFGGDASSVRKLAAQYGLSFTDSQIEGYVQNLLNNTMSVQQINDQFRNQAKLLYPSVSKQLDSGTLDDVTAAYKATAANILGTTSDMIDLTDKKFSPLLTFKDPASNEARLMNMTEWQRHLRSLPDWQKTKEASETYDNLYNSLRSLFGKVS